MTREPTIYSISAWIQIAITCSWLTRSLFLNSSLLRVWRVFLATARIKFTHNFSSLITSRLYTLRSWIRSWSGSGLQFYVSVLERNNIKSKCYYGGHVKYKEHWNYRNMKDSGMWKARRRIMSVRFINASDDNKKFNEWLRRVACDIRLYSEHTDDILVFLLWH